MLAAILPPRCAVVSLLLAIYIGCATGAIQPAVAQTAKPLQRLSVSQLSDPTNRRQSICAAPQTTGRDHPKVYDWYELAEDSNDGSFTPGTNIKFGVYKVYQKKCKSNDEFCTCMVKNGFAKEWYRLKSDLELWEDSGRLDSQFRRLRGEAWQVLRLKIANQCPKVRDMPFNEDVFAEGFDEFGEDDFLGTAALGYISDARVPLTALTNDGEYELAPASASRTHKSEKAGYFITARHVLETIHAAQDKSLIVIDSPAQNGNTRMRLIVDPQFLPKINGAQVDALPNNPIPARHEGIVVFPGQGGERSGAPFPVPGRSENRNTDYEDIAVIKAFIGPQYWYNRNWEWARGFAFSRALAQKYVPLTFGLPPRTETQPVSMISYTSDAVEIHEDNELSLREPDFDRDAIARLGDFFNLNRKRDDDAPGESPLPTKGVVLGEAVKKGQSGSPFIYGNYQGAPADSDRYSHRQFGVLKRLFEGRYSYCRPGVERTNEDEEACEEYRKRAFVQYLYNARRFLNSDHIDGSVQFKNLWNILKTKDKRPCQEVGDDNSPEENYNCVLQNWFEGQNAITELDETLACLTPLEANLLYQRIYNLTHTPTGRCRRPGDDYPMFSDTDVGGFMRGKIFPVLMSHGLIADAANLIATSCLAGNIDPQMVSAEDLRLLVDHAEVLEELGTSEQDKLSTIETAIRLYQYHLSAYLVPPMDVRADCQAPRSRRVETARLMTDYARARLLANELLEEQAIDYWPMMYFASQCGASSKTISELAFNGSMIEQKYNVAARAAANLYSITGDTIWIERWRNAILSEREIGKIELAHYFEIMERGISKYPKLQNEDIVDEAIEWAKSANLE